MPFFHTAFACDKPSYSRAYDKLSTSASPATACGDSCISLEFLLTDPELPVTAGSRTNAGAAAMTPFEQQLDSAFLVHSCELAPCNAYVRFLLNVLQQQPFCPAYTMHPSPDTASVRDQLLELPSAHQTDVLVKILKVRTAFFLQRSLSHQQ